MKQITTFCNYLAWITYCLTFQCLWKIGIILRKNTLQYWNGLKEVNEYSPIRATDIFLEKENSKGCFQLLHPTWQDFKLRSNSTLIYCSKQIKVAVCTHHKCRWQASNQTCQYFWWASGNVTNIRTFNWVMSSKRNTSLNLLYYTQCKWYA